MANITQTGKNSYRIRVYAGENEKGHKQFFTKIVKVDASLKKKERDLYLETEAKRFEVSCVGRTVIETPIFKDFAEQWFEEYAKLSFRDTTYRRMEFLKEQTYNAIGKYKLDKINNVVIQHFIDSLATLEGYGRSGHGLSTKTCKHYLTFVSDVFDYAVRMGLVSDNPCRNVHVKNRHDEKDKQVYSIEEVTQLLKALEKAPLKYQVFFYIAAYTGLRRSEILGLKFSDIDDSGIMRVRRSANYVAHKGTFIDDTKTESSKRNIQLPQIIMPKFNALRKLQISERLSLGIIPENDDYIFCTPLYDGIMNANTPYGYLRRFCKAENIRFAGIHSFRHFTASVLISQGMDVATTAKYLGHSSPNTTMSVYIHEFKGAEIKASQVIENTLSLR